MVAMIEQHADALRELCSRFHVRRLDLFGSATGPAFDPQRSDLDFLVEFSAHPRLSRFDQYFGFLEALQALFQRKVDLVESGAMRNPYFIRDANRSRTSLYAA